ncbi:hypothetical protein [Escherichia coli]
MINNWFLLLSPINNHLDHYQL